MADTVFLEELFFEAPDAWTPLFDRWTPPQSPQAQDHGEKFYHSAPHFALNPPPLVHALHLMIRVSFRWLFT